MRQWPETSRGVDLEKDRSKYYWTVNTSPNTECFRNAGSLLHGKIEIRVAVGSDSCKNGFDLSSVFTQDPISSSPRARPSNWVTAALYSYMIVAVSLHFIKPT